MWGTVVVVHPKWLYDSVEQKGTINLVEWNYRNILIRYIYSVLGREELPAYQCRY